MLWNTMICSWKLFDSLCFQMIVVCQAQLNWTCLKTTSSCKEINSSLDSSILGLPDRSYIVKNHREGKVKTLDPIDLYWLHAKRKATDPGYWHLKLDSFRNICCLEYQWPKSPFFGTSSSYCDIFNTVLLILPESWQSIMCHIALWVYKSHDK